MLKANKMWLTQQIKTHKGGKINTLLTNKT